MKKLVAIISIMFCLCGISAQTIEPASYGERLNKNFNLRFRTPDRASWEVSAAALGGNQGVGGQLSVAYMLHTSSNFAWGGGVEASLTSKEHYGALADAMAKLTARVGNKVFLEMSGLLGAGQLPFEDWSSNEDIQGTAVYYSSSWRAKVGAEVAVGFKASKTVNVSAFGRYTHGFASDNTRTAQVWVQDPIKNHPNAVSGGVRITFIF